MNRRKNETMIEVKPLRDYISHDIERTKIKVEDVVVAKVVSIWEHVISLELSNGCKATMSMSDFNSSESDENNENEVVALIGQNILARVKYIDLYSIILERNSVIEETMHVLYCKMQAEENLRVCVVKTTRYGVFVDIGNGIISMIPNKNLSKSRHYNSKKIYFEGDELLVRIIGYNEITRSFEVSRKAAYGRNLPKVGSIVVVICSTPLKDNTGLYVEFDPANSGIMDFPMNMRAKSFKDGEKIVVKVNKIVPQGARCTFVKKVM